ncbi:MAG TPA: hypothetical protein VGQ36_01485 [Thermoanaerobaculia bacterium]|jgi:hypothetical protein|nr:hypothetical protein [Thermoanaerobaculia bacterium]
MQSKTVPGIRLFCVAVLLFGIATFAHAEDISGKWIGTNESTTVYCDVPPVSSGPAEVEITQTGDSFSGTYLFTFANPTHCIPTTILSSFLLDLAGTVDGSSFEAAVSHPEFGYVGPMTGSVSGNAMSFTLIIPTNEDHDDPTELIDTIVTAQLRRVSPPSVSVGSLWPPNHKMVDVGLGVTSSFVVYSDEDDGDSQDASGSLLLRAERAGTGDGRVYLIASSSTDAFGNTTDSCLTVVVPKSQSASHIASVNAQAAVALSQCPSPAGYFVIGD